MNAENPLTVLNLMARAIEEADIDENVYLSATYSGRGMYGKMCPSIDGSPRDLVKVLIKAALINPEFFEDAELDSFSQDSMGLGVVWYWRHIDTEGVEWDEDDDY